MKEFSVNVSDKSRSNIYIENGLLASAGKIIKDNFNSKKIALISDTNVYPLYGEKIKAQQFLQALLCFLKIPLQDKYKWKPKSLHFQVEP